MAHKFSQNDEAGALTVEFLKAANLTELELKVLPHLLAEAGGNGYDFGIMELVAEQGIVGTKQLSGVTASLSKKGIIWNYGPDWSTGEKVTQYIFGHNDSVKHESAEAVTEFLKELDMQDAKDAVRAAKAYVAGESLSDKVAEAKAAVRPVNMLEGKLVLRDDEIHMVRAALKDYATTTQDESLRKDILAVAEACAEDQLAHEPRVLIDALEYHVGAVSFYYARKVRNLVSKLQRAAVQAELEAGA